MLARLVGPLVRWFIALKASRAPAACAGCLAAEMVRTSQAAELARATEREKLYLAQIQNLQNQMAALADTRAAATAARISAEHGPNGPRPRVPRERSLALPSYIGGVNVNLARARDLQVKRQEAMRVGMARPRQAE